MITTSHPWHGVPVGNLAPRIVNAIVEIPQGSRAKYEIDKDSGFTQMIYKSLGVPLLRDAYQQATQGEGIGFLQEVKCGDLAFFDNVEGRITHVGILLNEREIIHSSGKVRIDRIDSQGILNTDTQERTHQLRLIKRYF